MKVLHIFKTYYPDTHGGTEEFIAQLSRQTAKWGVENTVLTLSRHPQPESLVINGVKVIRLQESGRPWGLPWSWSMMTRWRTLLKDYDLIHFHQPWPFAECLYLLLGQKTRAITTYHLDLVRSPMVVSLYRMLLRLFFPRMHSIVATSDAYVRSSQILPHYLQQVAVIPIGIDFQAKAPSSLDSVRAWHARFGPQFFLFLGSFRYYKGLDVLLQAAQQVNAPIVLLGGGLLYEQMQAKASEYGVLDRVHFLGSVSELDKWALLNACTALILPSTSRAEAFGICLLEAMLCAKPLVTTELGTGTSWVNLHEETGYVVSPNDSQALAKAMNHYLNDPTLAEKHGQAGRARLEALFTADAMGQAYWDIYQKAKS